MPARLSACSITSGSCVAQTTAAPVVAGEAREENGDRDRIGPVEPRRRLVGEQDRRPGGDRARDRDARPLAVRQPGDALGRALARARPHSSAASARRPRLLDPAQRRARARRSRAPRGAGRARPAGRRRRSSRGGAPRAARGRARVSSTPSTDDRPRVRQLEAGEQVQQCRLARAGRTGDRVQPPVRAARRSSPSSTVVSPKRLCSPRADADDRVPNGGVRHGNGVWHLHSTTSGSPAGSTTSRPSSKRAVACAPIPARSSSSSGRRSQPPRPTTIVSPAPAVARPLLGDAAVADADDPVGDRAPTPGRGSRSPSCSRARARARPSTS